MTARVAALALAPLLAPMGTRQSDLAGAALDALVLQPAHFIMELGVLRGVKRRVERAGASDAVTSCDATRGLAGTGR